jgi:hypothetical protein
LSSIGLVAGIVDASGTPHVIFGLGIEVYACNGATFLLTSIWGDLIGFSPKRWC